MLTAILNHESMVCNIQCKLTESVKDMIDKFLSKSKNKKENMYFLYDGKSLNEQNEQLALEKLINSEDKERNEMNILVYNNITSDNENYDNQRDMVKSKNIIICPKCGEKAKIDFKNYKISLTCKNKIMILQKIFHLKNLRKLNIRMNQK